ncbi:MAG TPA: ATP-binding cassette domain-containing protein [Alphaproteobacteria bacterium]|jgi:branched-chain amino acid transport system ATP-binding protein|nr:ATP-binding cassette domain-containing protein [Alphaproteobacteria bacterium]
MTAILTIDGLTMRFGGLTAIDAVSFEVRPAAITALIGPNGAGKTTLFNCVTGFYRPTKGGIRLNRAGGPVQLAGLPNHRIARLGVARTFQNIRLFGRMTVLENLLVAQHAELMRASLFSIAGILGLPRYRKAEAQAIETARHWLDRVGLTARANDPADTLPYGDQRRLEIVRAICTGPRLLCLDEPAAGLNPRESADLAALIRAISAELDLAVLLIEHDMSVVMGISDHIVVLDYGRKIAEGPPAAIRADKAVIAAYLGEPEDAVA